MSYIRVSRKVYKDVFIILRGIVQLTKVRSRGIKSLPPEGKKKIKNIWWDNDTGEIVFDIED